MRRAGTAALVAVIVALAGEVARAQADTPAGCPAADEAAASPLAGGTATWQPADFGAIPEACPGSDVWLRLRGELVDASGAPDFFGRIIATASARGRRRIGARSWISVAVDAVTYRYTDDASLAASSTSFGPISVGYHRTVVARARGAAAVYARVLLPLDTGRQSSYATGLELGGSGRAHLGRRWVVDGGLSLAGPLTVSGGQAHGALQPAGLAEVWLVARPTLALFAGASLRAVAAPDANLVMVAPRAGVRATLGRGIWLGALGEAPVAGTDRTNVMASLFAGFAP